MEQGCFSAFVDSSLLRFGDLLQWQWRKERKKGRRGAIYPVITWRTRQVILFPARGVMRSRYLIHVFPCSFGNVRLKHTPIRDSEGRCSVSLNCANTF